MTDSEASVYVVDDDVSSREAIVGLCRAAGFSAIGFACAAEFLAHPRPPAVGCLVLDVAMPDLSGLDLQQRLRSARDALPIVFVTGHGSIPMSVTAIKAGAVDFLMKPFDADALLEAIRRAMAQSEQRRENPAVADVVGRSEALRAVLRQIDMVAGTDTTILLQGETGTGKECLARSLHQLSARRQGPFVKVNCAAIPAGLLESELMGHERGAFTGAVARRIGRFELAQEGTLFLDEIGELPVELQPKLLRVLQEREFERLGGATTIRTNARVVAATNRDLKSMVASRTFREDLYYRLSVFPIIVPPLRERKEDIPILARHFVADLSRRLGRRVEDPSEAMLARLARQSWPGNIRELQNVLERAAILAEGADLDFPDGAASAEHAPDLPDVDHSQQSGLCQRGDDVFDLAAFIREQLSPASARDLYAETHRCIDRILLTLVLDHTRGNQRGAAQLLGISRQTMRTRLRTLGIQVSHRVEAVDASVASC